MTAAHVDSPVQASPERSTPPLVELLEAIFLASERPVSIEQLLKIFGTSLGINRKEIKRGLELLATNHATRCTQLVESASGWHLQLREAYAPWVHQLEPERTNRMSRAALETLALIIYRQPITRGEIEEIRGVAVSSQIIRGLIERGWVCELGHKDAPGRPALLGSTTQFLDDFNLTSLDQLPSLPALRDNPQIDALLAAMQGATPPVNPTTTANRASAAPPSNTP